MADTRNLGNRIRTLTNMQKVMHAMNMIATVKLQKLIRIRGPLDRFQAAAAGFSDDIRHAFADGSHPFVLGWPKTSIIHVILITADRGLCGSHNSSVERAAAALVAEAHGHGADAELTCLGLKGAGFCASSGFPVVAREEINERTLDDDRLGDIASLVCSRFLAGSVQEVHLVWDRFVSTIHQEATAVRLLPLPDAAAGTGETAREEYGIEPSAPDFIAEAGRLLLYYRLRAALVESRLSEQAARMTAMENAMRNADDLVSRYRLTQNRTRQNAITNEITEIVSGMQSMR